MESYQQQQQQLFAFSLLSVAVLHSLAETKTSESLSLSKAISTSSSSSKVCYVHKTCKVEISEKSLRLFVSKMKTPVANEVRHKICHIECSIKEILSKFNSTERKMSLTLFVKVFFILFYRSTKYKLNVCTADFYYLF